MHSVQSYLKGMTSQELKSILWTAEFQPCVIAGEVLIIIRDILRDRGDLNPDTAALVERCLEQQKKVLAEKQLERKRDNRIDLDSFFHHRRNKANT